MHLFLPTGLMFGIHSIAHNSLIREPIVSLWSYQTSPSVSL
jgi:hypothetical protein